MLSSHTLVKRSTSHSGSGRHIGLRESIYKIDRRSHSLAKPSFTSYTSARYHFLHQIGLNGPQEVRKLGNAALRKWSAKALGKTLGCLFDPSTTAAWNKECGLHAREVMTTCRRQWSGMRSWVPLCCAPSAFTILQLQPVTRTCHHHLDRHRPASMLGQMFCKLPRHVPVV